MAQYQISVFGHQTAVSATFIQTEDNTNIAVFESILKRKSTRITSGRKLIATSVISVCSQINTKHINTLCGQNVELLNVKLVVHIITTGL